jgi:hypothetical protein
MSSADGGHPHVVRWLIEQRADVFARDREGVSALSRAVMSGKMSTKHLECAVMLLKAEVEKGGPRGVSDEEIATWEFDDDEEREYIIDQVNHVWDNWCMGAQRCLEMYIRGEYDWHQSGAEESARAPLQFRMRVDAYSVLRAYGAPVDFEKRFFGKIQRNVLSKFRLPFDDFGNKMFKTIGAAVDVLREVETAYQNSHLPAWRRMRRHELGQALAEHMPTFLPTPLQLIVVAYLCDGSDSFGAAHSIPDILAAEVIRDSEAATDWHAYQTLAE